MNSFKLSKHKPVLYLSLAAFIFYGCLDIYKYIHFAYQDWDHAEKCQSLWNLLHGQLYTSLFGYNSFGDHATFIDLFILPIFAVVPHPLTMSFVVIFFFALSATLLYRMFLDNIHPRSAFLLTFAYLIFPPNLLALSHDVNSEALTPFFILLVIYFFRQKRLIAFYLSFLFLFVFKENMPLIVAMIGLWGICAKERNRWVWGVVPIILSLIYFVVMVKWVIPHFLGHKEHSLWVRYPYLLLEHHNLWDYLKDAPTVLKVFLSPENGRYLISLFGILLVPAILSPSVLLLIAPIITYHLLSVHMPEKTIYYYYAIALTPVIFLAVAQTLGKIKLLRDINHWICWMLIFGCFYQLFLNRQWVLYKIGYGYNTHISKAWEFVNKIPKDAGVVATFEFLPALSLRQNLFSFHKVYSDEYQSLTKSRFSDFYSGKIFKLPDTVSYALIDLTDPWLRKSLQNQEVKSRLDNFFKHWQITASQGPVLLLIKK